MERSHKVYNQIGDVHFPVHGQDYHDLTHLRPEESGVLTVRLLIEDTSMIGPGFEIVQGPPPTHDDFLVGCDRFKTAKDAHEYFGAEHKIIDNILLGAIDWCGVTLVPGTANIVEFFRCEFKHLNEAAQRAYRTYESRYPGCQLWLITSLDRKKETVTQLMREIDRMGHTVERIPRVPLSPNEQIVCRGCEAEGKLTIKPHISAKRLGWQKIKSKHWLCPDHVAQNAKPVN